MAHIYKVTPSSQQIELKLFVAVIVVIFFINTPLGMFKKEKVEDYFSQIESVQRNFSLKFNVVNSYLALVETELIENHQQYAKNINQLTAKLAKNNPLIESIEVIPEFNQQALENHHRLSTYTAITNSVTDDVDNHYFFSIDDKSLSFIKPIPSALKFNGYLIVNADVEQLFELTSKEMFMLDEDGYVFASTSTSIAPFSYLAAQNPKLVETIESINRDKGVLEVGKHVYLYEKTGISMGKKTYLIKDIPNQQLIPTYYYVIIVLVLVVVLVFYYLKKLWQERHSLTRLSYIDELSGLHNRHYLKKIEANLDVTSSYFVAIFDIDHFKRVNDKYGHAIGDQVIKRVANVIKLSIRNDDYAFRIGGEEFCVIVKTHSSIEALGIFERIRSEIQSISQHPKVTISGGATSYARGLSESTNFADKLLYTAKQSGRNQIIADWTRH